MKKITQLTAEQERQMIEFREEWQQISLAVGPADVHAITPVTNRFYAQIGKPPPLIWHCDSPMMIQLWINIISMKIENKLDNLRDNLWSNLRDNLRDNLGANLRASLGDNLLDNLRDNLRDNLGSNLGDNL